MKGRVHYFSNEVGGNACGAAYWISGSRAQRAARNTRDRKYVTCPPCKAWLRMTPEQRTAAELERRAKERAKDARQTAAFAVLKDRKRLSDGWAKLGRVIAVGMSRFDAVVAMDVLEEIRGGREATPIEIAFLTRVCAIAIMAHRIEHPRSRGDRLWIYRQLEIVDARADAHLRNQVCRFCDAVVRERVLMGADRSIAGNAAEVSTHTMACAAKYLAGSLAPQPSSEALHLLGPMIPA